MKTCQNGCCTSCGVSVAWVWSPNGWRLFETGPEHHCPEGGYTPRSGQPPRRPVNPNLRKLIEAALAADDGGDKLIRAALAKQNGGA